YVIAEGDVDGGVADILVVPADRNLAARLRAGGVDRQVGDLEVGVRRQGRAGRGAGAVVALARAGGVVLKDAVARVRRDRGRDLADAGVAVGQAEGVLLGNRLACPDRAIAGGRGVVGDDGRGQGLAGGAVDDRDVVVERAVRFAVVSGVAGAGVSVAPLQRDVRARL